MSHGQRLFKVKLVGFPVFSMIAMEDDVDALAVCISIFGADRVEWVR